MESSRSQTPGDGEELTRMSWEAYLQCITVCGVCELQNTHKGVILRGEPVPGTRLSSLVRRSLTSY